MSKQIIHFEALLKPSSGASLFGNEKRLKLSELKASKGQSQELAKKLEAFGFKVLHIGKYSVSGQASQLLWEKVFKTTVEERTLSFKDGCLAPKNRKFFCHIKNTNFTLPDELQDLTERIYPQKPPYFYESPLPPRVSYHHLRVPSDVALICNAAKLHREGVTGNGVKIAMVDTGFYRHPFYELSGYRYRASLSADAKKIEMDEDGHGTAEAANIFANAPDVDFYGIKMGANPTLAFKTAMDLVPAIISNSWGYDIEGESLPNYLKALELTVRQAVEEKKMVVCFSAGNGQLSFPGQMPEVISVGGVYASDVFKDGFLELRTSDYASSFESQVYKGRIVPDLCGLVGLQPKAAYILLPLPSASEIDKNMSGKGFPEYDETEKKDGWASISGTSAACPQVAGVCALLKQLNPKLNNQEIKTILQNSAKDVLSGDSFHGDKSSKGKDKATGYGLVDAYAAYKSMGV